MQTFNSLEFKEATRDKFFYDLVQAHMDKSRNISSATTALQETIALLPNEINESIEVLLTDLIEFSEINQLIPMKCADVFREIENFSREYFSIGLTNEDILNLFNIYIILITCYAYSDERYKNYLGARYGTSFMTKFLYERRLKNKYNARYRAFANSRENGMSEHEAMEYVNELLPATVAEDVYFEKMRLQNPAAAF